MAKSKDKRKLKTRLKLVRLEQKKTLQDVADALEMSNGAIANYENEIREPKLETWKKLADYFDVSIGWLQGVSDVRNPLSMIDILNESEKTDTHYIIDTDIVDKNLPAWSRDKMLEEYIGIISVVKNSKHLSKPAKEIIEANENIEDDTDAIISANGLTSAVSHLVEIYFKGKSGYEPAEKVFEKVDEQMSDYMFSEILKEEQNK